MMPEPYDNPSTAPVCRCGTPTIAGVCVNPTCSKHNQGNDAEGPRDD